MFVPHPGHVLLVTDLPRGPPYRYLVSRWRRFRRDRRATPSAEPRTRPAARSQRGVPAPAGTRDRSVPAHRPRAATVLPVRGLAAFRVAQRRPVAGRDATQRRRRAHVERGDDHPHRVVAAEGHRGRDTAPPVPQGLVGRAGADDAARRGKGGQPTCVRPRCVPASGRGPWVPMDRERRTASAPGRDRWGERAVAPRVPHRTVHHGPKRTTTVHIIAPMNWPAPALPALTRYSDMPDKDALWPAASPPGGRPRAGSDTTATGHRPCSPLWDDGQEARARVPTGLSSHGG